MKNGRKSDRLRDGKESVMHNFQVVEGSVELSPLLTDQYMTIIVNHFSQNNCDISFEPANRKLNIYMTLEDDTNTEVMQAIGLLRNSVDNGYLAFYDNDLNKNVTYKTGFRWENGLFSEKGPKVCDLADEDTYSFTDDEFSAIDGILYRHGSGITPDEFWLELRYLGQSKSLNASVYHIFDHDEKKNISLSQMVELIDDAMCDVNWDNLDPNEQTAWTALLKKCGVRLKKTNIRGLMG